MRCSLHIGKFIYLLLPLFVNALPVHDPLKREYPPPIVRRTSTPPLSRPVSEVPASQPLWGIPQDCYSLGNDRNPGENSWHNFVYLDHIPIGSGGEGQVMKAVHVKDYKVVPQLVAKIEHTRRGYNAAVLIEELDLPELIVKVHEKAIIPYYGAERISDNDAREKGSSLVLYERLQSTVFDWAMDLKRDPAFLRTISTKFVHGLVEIHRKNVAHRDIKPQNYMFTTFDDRRPEDWMFKFIDFGLARDATRCPTDDNSCSLLVGTPGYASPGERHKLKQNSKEKG